MIVIMTKKEKKEEALRLKAEIEAKKPQPEKPVGLSKEEEKKYNRTRYTRRDKPDDFVKWLREKGKRNKPGEL